jgi:hypothetical protein
LQIVELICVFHIGFLWISSSCCCTVFNCAIINTELFRSNLISVLSFLSVFSVPWIGKLMSSSEFNCYCFVRIFFRNNASVVSQPKICHDHQDYSCILNDIFLELWSMVGCVACLYWIAPFWLLCCIPLANLTRLHFFRSWLGKSMRDTILRICDVYIWYFSKKNRYRGSF